MATRMISLEELKRHSGPESNWVAIAGNVYDVTKFVNEHPGGPAPLKGVAGKDGTQAFAKVGHSNDALELRELFLVGKLQEKKGWSWGDYAINIGIPLVMFIVLYKFASKY